MEKKIVIIGAGLTGMTLAYYLDKANISYVIVEARDRTGGRILTDRTEDVAPIELGATWLGRQHKALNQLIKELSINVFPQKLGKTAVYEHLSTSPPQLVQLPPNNDPSYRIAGGTDVIISELASRIKKDQIFLSSPVLSITTNDEQLIVKTEKEIYFGTHVVSTLPPNLLVNTIKFDDSLSDDLLSIAMTTHTWMSDSIKVGLRYENPFWREGNRSGTIFSNVGPIPEMYDHSTIDDDQYALKGFFNGVYYSITPEQREKMVMTQLQKYLGPEVKEKNEYVEKVWCNEVYSHHSHKEHILPHHNNGHQIYRKTFLNGKFFVAGTETATQNPGYMEGAVQSARETADKLISFNA